MILEVDAVLCETEQIGHQLFRDHIGAQTIETDKQKLHSRKTFPQLQFRHAIYVRTLHFRCHCPECRLENLLNIQHSRLKRHINVSELALGPLR